MPQLPLKQRTQPSGGVPEYSFLITDALRNGLSPDPRMPRNSPYLESMSNLRASEFGLISPEAITNPISNGPTPNWGSSGTVQMFRGEVDRWVMGQTAYYSANSSWVATLVDNSITAGTHPWRAVFFQGIAFFTNTSTFIYRTNSLTGKSTTTPAVVALGKHENRLLLGNVSGTPVANAAFTTMVTRWKNTQQGDRFSHASQAWDSGWMLYGERGGGASDRPFEPLLALLGLGTGTQREDIQGYLESELENYNWGFARLRYPGALLAFHELADAPLAFGENGVSRMRQDGNIYYDDRLHAIGIPAPGCVGGDLYTCLFVDSNREIWTVEPSGRPVRHRLSQHLANLTLANVTIAFDPAERNFWISDKSQGFLFDSRGKLSGPFERFPTSLVREGGNLYGVIRDTRSDTSKFAVSFKTLPIDISERANKHVSTMQFSTENVTKLKAGADYRYKNADSFGVGNLSSDMGNGAVIPYPPVSGVDLKIKMTGEVASASTAVIDRVRVQYQSEDNTSLRGTKGIPSGDAGSE